MRKRIISRSSKEPSSADQDWLDLERLAQVEIRPSADSPSSRR